MRRGARGSAVASPALPDSSWTAQLLHFKPLAASYMLYLGIGQWAVNRSNVQCFFCAFQKKLLEKKLFANVIEHYPRLIMKSKSVSHSVVSHSL